MTSPARPSGPPAAARTRARRGEGDQLRDELLDAAEELLVREGSMDAVSIRAVATAVGVTAPSLYRHFDDKDDLFYAVCERRFGVFDDVLATAAEGIEDPVERLRAMGLAYIRYGVEHAEHYELLFGPQAAQLVGDRDLTDSAGLRTFGRLVETVAEGIDRGVLRDDQEPWMTAFALWSAVHGAVMIVLAKDGLAGSGFPLPPLEVLAETCCTSILSGIST